MRTHAFLSITGQTFQVKLSIDEMTSYWAVSVSQKLKDAEYIINQRFKAIGCSFALDLNKFFEEEKSLIFTGISLDGVENQRLAAAMGSTVTYLAKKLDLEIMRADFISK